MDPTTIRLPETTLDDLDSEYSDYGYGSRADYIRDIIEHRDPPYATTATTDDYDQPTTDDYQRLRARVAEIEERLDALPDALATSDELETLRERVAGLESGGEAAGLDIDVPADLSSGTDPYPEQVETALAVVRQAGERVPKRAILEAVPDVDINEDSLYDRHIVPELRERGDHKRGVGWWIDDDGD